MPDPKQSPDGPASAPDATPEPLSAILAEMRGLADHRAADAGGERPAVELLRSYADRIEAAAARERDEDRQLAAIAESDEAFARCARCDRPERAPGNAAALREALSDACYAMFNFLKTQPGGYEEMAIALDKAKAALSAPARNCDRFHDEDEAVRAYLDEVCSLADNGAPTNEIACNLKMIRWLFSEAKGGDHA